MSETISEYTVRDFSAVDEQVRQIAERERIVTQKLKLVELEFLCNNPLPVSYTHLTLPTILLV